MAKKVPVVRLVYDVETVTEVEVVDAYDMLGLKALSREEFLEILAAHAPAQAVKVLGGEFVPLGGGTFMSLVDHRTIVTAQEIAELRAGAGLPPSTLSDR